MPITRLQVYKLAIQAHVTADSDTGLNCPLQLLCGVLLGKFPALGTLERTLTAVTNLSSRSDGWGRTRSRN
jgi:hypothetical protein